MTSAEAEKIVQAYGGAIAEAESGIRRLSSLPCSKAKIKQAYFTYIPAIYDNYGSLPNDVMQPLLSCYYMLNSFVDDETADRLEAIMRLQKAGKIDNENEKHKKLMKEYFSYVTGTGEKHEGGMQDGNLVDEINEFIGELYELRQK